MELPISWIPCLARFCLDMGVAWRRTEGAGQVTYSSFIVTFDLPKMDVEHPWQLETLPAVSDLLKIDFRVFRTENGGGSRTWTYRSHVINIMDHNCVSLMPPLEVICRVSQSEGVRGCLCSFPGWAGMSRRVQTTLWVSNLKDGLLESNPGGRESRWKVQS